MPTTTMARTWRILSIDGGGIRGIIPAVLLEQMEYGTGKQIAEIFDFIVGTSSGAITALALSAPETSTVARYRADDLVDLYIKQGPKIFQRIPFMEVSEWAFGGAKHDARTLEKILDIYFGATKLGDALTNVMVPTYCLETREPRFFKSWNKQDDGPYLMKDLARATTAAPTFFIPQRLMVDNVPMGFIDGGLVSNNPTMTALVECMRYAQPGDNFWIVSLGTGMSKRPYHYEEAIHWRPVDWIKPTIDVCMDGADAKTDYELLQLSRIPGITYYRFDTVIPSEFAKLDKGQPTNIQKLKSFGERIYQMEMRDRFDKMLAELIALSNQTKIPIQWTELAPEFKPFATKSTCTSVKSNITNSGQR